MKSLGRLDEAETLLKQALDTQQRVYGPNNTKLVGVLSQLGDLYRMQGKSGAAEAYFLRALAIHKANTREIDVYFATSRAPVEGSKTVAFGSLAATSLTLGQAKVVVAKPDSASGLPRSSEPFVDGAQVNQAPRVEVTEVARLAIRTIATGVDWTSPQNRKPFQKQVFVFVPGFNVSFENALRRTAQIAYDVDFDGAAVLFSWPSGSGLTSYLYSSAKTAPAANQLMVFLEKLIAQTGATKIHLIAHSMGSVVLLETLEKLKLKQRWQTWLRRRVCRNHPALAGRRQGSVQPGDGGGERPRQRGDAVRRQQRSRHRPFPVDMGRPRRPERVLRHRDDRYHRGGIELPGAQSRSLRDQPGHLQRHALHAQAGQAPSGPALRRVSIDGDARWNDMALPPQRSCTVCRRRTACGGRERGQRRGCASNSRSPPCRRRAS